MTYGCSWLSHCAGESELRKTEFFNCSLKRPDLRERENSMKEMRGPDAASFVQLAVGPPGSPRGRESLCCAECTVPGAVQKGRWQKCGEITF